MARKRNDQMADQPKDDRLTRDDITEEELLGDTEEEVSARHRPDELPPNARGPAGSAGGERHGQGGITGGTPIGGLGGSNTGDGTPDTDEVDEAVGSDEFDRQFDADEEDAYSGRSGGAVGGTPANKRSQGGTSSRRPAG